MEFKLIAIDLDGTLLNNDLEISPRAAAAIKTAESRGVKVTLCTGRMYASAYPYAQKLGINIPLITYNGALVKNSFDGEVLYEKNLPLEEARHVVKICREFDCQLNVYFDDKLYVEKSDYWAKKYAGRVNVPLHEVDDLLKFLKFSPIKLLAMGQEEVLHTIREQLSDRGLYITRSQPHFLEILNPEATKGKGLAAVVKRLAIDRKNVMAIGDNENDIEMFKYAGYAVVMANADDHVKAHADYVTKNNNDDGVAEAIEKLVLV
ncbi:Cof-type HAD-IIB family hydrolase [Desulfitibacter alkalitolerans]|uniref:Cof-type HAD-IIB family hydrolase n=1 Tax=Desulfitibacter alkalitolerans TaxID=264641 RepID=UPI0006867B1A|nr:Cof-type HAD-IIB family hydrolase [Desulfitibacter alkalitolerans]